MKEYFSQFDEKYKNLEFIDDNFYKNEIWVTSYVKKCTTKDVEGNRSEEYIRARFVYALVFSWKFQKEYICVEFSYPKWNSKTPIKPDIAIFKSDKWKEEYEKAKSTESKDFSWFRKNTLVVFEAKKKAKTVEAAVENQLRPEMAENESEERIFGVYFDNKDGILIFKKIWNSEIRRFYEDKELHLNWINWLQLQVRDSLSELPSQKDFINNNESISDITKLKTDNLDAIDEENFKEVLNTLKRENDKIKPKNDPNNLIVEFLTLKVFDEKRSKNENRTNEFYIKENEIQSWLWAESFRNRINQLYIDAKNKYPKVLSKPFFSYDAMMRPSDSNDERFLIAIVKIFQRKAILKSKNESFNQIIFNNFWSERQKAEKWQFFTPIPVVKAIIWMVNPIKNEVVCDPCSWICDFLAMSFRHTNRNETEYPNSASNYYWFDLEQSNLKLAELNLVLNWDWWAYLRDMDSLAQKLRADNEEPLAKWQFNDSNFYTETWEPKKDKDLTLKKYKIIVTNPPFWKWRDLKTWKDWKWDLPKETMNLYETRKVKKSLDEEIEEWVEEVEEVATKKKKKKKGPELPKSMDMWVLFLENAYKQLEEWGRMWIVLSNSIASIREWESVRARFISKMRIVALFDLPWNTFWETWVATTIIVAYKPTKKEIEKWLLDNDYEVFVREIENIGYEVKTKQRVIEFQPQYIINEETFENTNKLMEDFTDMQKDFIEYLKRQESEIKDAFHLDTMN